MQKKAIIRSLRKNNVPNNGCNVQVPFTREYDVIRVVCICVCVLIITIYYNNIKEIGKYPFSYPEIYPAQSGVKLSSRPLVRVRSTLRCAAPYKNPS